MMQMECVRLWLLALICLGCGVASRVAFAVFAPPMGRAEAMA
jgi:hypothetical protein